jgi:glucose-1-phosphate cytidylyltransferase
MREYTDTLPKALVPIGPEPVILHVMRIYGYFGYKRFVLCLGYRGDAIKEYFMNREWTNHDFKLKLGSKGRNVEIFSPESLGFEIVFADTGTETPTGGRIRKAAKYVDTDDFLATYCDCLADVLVDEILKQHKNMGKIGTVTGVHTMAPFGILDVDDAGIAVSFREKPTLPGYINGGFFVFKRDFFDYLKDDSTLEEEPLRRLASERQLAVYKHEGFWAAMDTFKDVERLNTLWQTGFMPHTGFRGKPPWVHI